MPKLSVIMNCYNGERFVKEAIDSVYAQTFKDWEIIFWDNASTDRTGEIAHQYDEKLRYFRADKTVLLGSARNLAMAQATGEWIAFVDYDDVCFPNRFERQMTAIGDGDYVLCSAGVRDVTEDGRMIRDIMPLSRTGDIFDAQLKQFDLYLQTTMIRTETMRKYRVKINEACHTLEDYNLFMKMLTKGRACIVPEILSTCRIVSNSLAERALERYAIERFLTLDELKAENSGIEIRHADAFNEATARGHYYHAKFLMKTGDYTAARREMRRTVSVAPIYTMLYLISLWPGLWWLVHNRQIKSRLSRFL